MPEKQILYIGKAHEYKAAPNIGTISTAEYQIHELILQIPKSCHRKILPLSQKKKESKCGTRQKSEKHVRKCRRDRSDRGGVLTMPHIRASCCG